MFRRKRIKVDGVKYTPERWRATLGIGQGGHSPENNGYHIAPPPGSDELEAVAISLALINDPAYYEDRSLSEILAEEENQAQKRLGSAAIEGSDAVLPSIAEQYAAAVGNYVSHLLQHPEILEQMGTITGHEEARAA